MCRPKFNINMTKNTAKRSNKADFPTPASPIITHLNK